METAPDIPNNGAPDAPAHTDDGSSDSSSNAEDDEWKPCRRKIVRRVNLVRSQATKLMWQRKKAAALQLQQQQREQALLLGGETSESSADTSGQDGSSPLPTARSSLALASPGAAAAQADWASPGTSASSSAALLASTPSRRQLQQPLQPPKKRRLQDKAPGASSSTTTTTGVDGGPGKKRRKRGPPVKLTWQQRRLAKLRLCRHRIRDPLSRAILRRDPVRFSMCWADTTLGSSRAGKPTPDKLSPTKLSPDKLSPDKLSPDKLSPDKLSHDKLGPNKLSPDKLSAEKLLPEKFSPEKFSPEKFSPEKLSPEKLSREKLSPEKPPTEKLLPVKVPLEKLPSEKPLPEKLPPEKLLPKKPSPEKLSPDISPCKPSPDNVSPYKPSPFKPSPFKPSPYKSSPYKGSPYKPSPYKPSPYKASPCRTPPYKTPPHKPSPYKLWNKLLPNKPSPDKPRNVLPKDHKTSPPSLVGPNLHDYASRPSTASDTSMGEEVAEMASSDTPVWEGSTSRPSLERACRPKMSLKEEESSSSEYSDDERGTPKKYTRLLPFRRPQLRPRLLQTYKTESDSDDDQLGTSEVEADKHEGQATTLAPRLVHQGNYVTEGEMPEPGEKYGPPIVTPIFRVSSSLPTVTYDKLKPMTATSRRKSLAAKLRWERRRALQRQKLLADSMRADPKSTGVVYSAPAVSSTPLPPVCVLPAKMRWKQDSHGALPPKRPEGPERSFLSSLPPKLRFKKNHSVFSMFKRDGTEDGGTSVASQLLTSAVTEPPDAGGCTLPAPLAVATIKTEPKEAPSERRSRAKRLWWEQIKQLNVKLSSNGSCALPEGSVEDLLNTLPKFLLEELFADKPSSTRKKKPAASPADGSARPPGTPSRRSLIMKENWRKRKQAWLMAAAQSLAAASQAGSAVGSGAASAGPSTPAASSSAEQQPLEQLPPSPQLCEDSGPAEGDGPYLERTLALQRCRQYRHGLIAQGDLQQRGRTSRHYNARGIHIASNKDACDCLQADCPGCHFPCAKCGSSKCGVECRGNRNWAYEQLEIDGVPDTVYQNTLLN